MNATLEQASSAASLVGKIALITGATSTYGIGRVSARAMAMAGAFVYVTSRDPQRGAAVVAEIEADGGKSAFLRLDVTIEEEWAAATDQVRKQFGRLDILVNNAGNLVNGPIEDMPLEDVRYMVRLNMEGPFLGMTYAWPLMKDSGGVIMDINSTGGQGGSFGSSAYGGSKGGMLGTTKAAAIDGRQYGIRAISIHPGGTWTPGMERVTGLTEEQYKRGIREKRSIPLLRPAESADVAAAVVYFASDEARNVNGIEYNIDGGSSAG